ncbi:RES family NAD+ phosphorylase [Rhizobiaceae sp. 2RAB30]
MPEGRQALAQILWRAYVPRWAHAPLSGEGAARFGGRWNPVGVATIYVACELSTAWAEYNQGFVQHPALIVQLELSGARLADLTDPAFLDVRELDQSLHSLEWRAEIDQGNEPLTHKVQRTLFREGFDGVVYPSFMSPGGNCVALWRWNGNSGPVLKVVDPEGRLPRDAASWL